ncbi:hypothetical protein [Mycoplasma mycoides]
MKKSRNDVKRQWRTSIARVKKGESYQLECQDQITKVLYIDWDMDICMN